MNIGEKLYELRKGKNLSQEEVADKLNVTRQTISKWETNQSTPDFDKIKPLCELYGITADELLTGEKKEKGTRAFEQTRHKKRKSKWNSSRSVILLYSFSMDNDINTSTIYESSTCSSNIYTTMWNCNI